MSKIDLSKAKIGDKFINKEGNILQFIRYYFEYVYAYELKDAHGRCYSVTNDGSFIEGEENSLDLVVQVLDDEKDRAITDKILKDVEKVVNGVAGAMPLIESAAIANLLRKPLPENNEDIDLLDNSISVEERGQVIAQMAKNEYEIAKELGFAIQNLPYIVEQPKEDNPELQRRQEVVELAEKLVTNELFAVTNHMHDMRKLGAVINLDSPTEYAFLIAEEFVNNKSKYLENGKLC